MTKLKLIFVLVLFASTCHAQQYGWRVFATPRPGYQMKAVEFKDSLHGWCTAGEFIYRTTDGGHTWETGSQPSLPNGFYDISFYDSLCGWAVGTFSGSEGLIWRTADGGRTWSEKLYKNGRQYNGTAARGTAGNITTGSAPITSILDSGTVVQTTDGGSHWVEQALADSITYTGQIQFIDSLYGWMSAIYQSKTGGPNGSGLLRTTDGGNSWHFLESRIGRYCFVDTTNGFAYGGRNTAHENNGIYVLWTRDAGQTWTSTFVPDSSIQGVDVSITAVSLIDTLSGWMFGDTFFQGDSREIVIRTTDGGTTWFRESEGLTDIIGDALMLDKHHGWAVSFNGEVLGYELITSVVEHLPELPTGFILKQNYPNPFNNSAIIEYEIPKESDVRIVVFDGIGKLITTLVDQIQPAGVYRLRFDAKSLSSDIYYYTMTAGLYRNTKQLILLK